MLHGLLAATLFNVIQLLDGNDAGKVNLGHLLLDLVQDLGDVAFVYKGGDDVEDAADLLVFLVELLLLRDALHALFQARLVGRHLVA